MWVTWTLALGVLLAIASPHGVSQAQPEERSADDQELVVATKEAPPFVMKHADGTLHGLSIDLWRRVADRLHLRYRFTEQPTVQALLGGTAEGSFDAAIAALTVTAARDRVVDFTQPFYSSGLGVAVSTGESRWRSVSRALLSFGFFQAVIALVGLALCMGSIVWLCERRRTEHFGGGARGLGRGLWWAAIAMTQAGAAQNAPATLPGRIVGVAWMITSLIAIAVFTAGITSTLTRRELQGIVHGVNDLRSVRVGAPRNTATMDYLSRQRISYREFSDPLEGLKALEAGSIDAFVYDKPLLTWLVLQDFSSSLRVLDIAFGAQSYAIALPKGSPLRQTLDAPLLEETESDWWEQTLFEYLGKKQ
jgi:polar amino acid transport system substrate-binding protein